MPYILWLKWKMFYVKFVVIRTFFSLSWWQSISLQRNTLPFLLLWHSFPKILWPKHGSLSRYSQQQLNGQWSIFKEFDHWHIWENSYKCKRRRDFSMIYCALCIINRVEICLSSLQSSKSLFKCPNGANKSFFVEYTQIPCIFLSCLPLL